MKSFIVKNLRLLIVASLPWLAVNLGSLAYADDDPEPVPPPKASIDLTTQVYLGDESELDREKYFNVHGSYSGPALTSNDMEFLYDELNVGMGRSFWSPFSAYSGVAPYPTEAEAAAAGATAVQNHMTTSNYPYRSHRMVVTDHPRNVLELDEDPVLAAEWAVRYFKHYYADDYRPIFYEPMNEPFVHADDFVEGPWDPVANAEVMFKMTTWFKEIGKAFREADMPVNITGYSSAWPSMELWDFGHWDSRMKMFMDEAGDYMDAFTVHLYDGVNVVGADSFRSGSNSFAILDLMETYSNIKWGFAKPHALTEYGGIPAGWGVEYHPGQSAASINSYNHLLFGFLERQDRILTSIPFVTLKSPWFYNNNDFQPYGADMWRPDPDQIVGTKVNGFLLTEKVKFYQLWADVRGNRAQIDSNDPDLRAHAFVHGPTAYICLNNLEDEDKDVALDFASGLTGLQSVTVKRLVVPTNQAASLTEVTQATAPANIVLAPHETAILSYQFNSPIQFDRQSHSRTYYSATHLQSIVADEELTFRFTGVQFCDDDCDACEGDDDDEEEGEDDDEGDDDDDEKYAFLRMGISRKHDMSKAPEVEVNGDEIAVPADWAGYDQANRADFFGAIEIPVPVDELESTTDVTIRFPDSGGRVSSLVLVVEECKAYEPIALEALSLPETFAINKDKSDKIRASFTPHNATDKYVVWSSSDESIATVSQDGTIHPVVPGEVTITATSISSGLVASSLVTVRDRLSIPDKVTILTDLSDVIQSDSYLIEMAYSAPVERDLAIEMRVDGNWKGIRQITVPAGTGIATLNLTFNETIPAGVGTWIGSIRPVGGDWRTTLDSHKQDNTIIRPDPTLVDIFEVVSDLDAIPSKKNITLDFSYIVAEPRDIEVHFWSPWVPGSGASWLGWGKARVQPGEGVATVTISNGVAPPADSPYEFRTFFKAIDGTEIARETYYATVNDIGLAVDQIRFETDLGAIASRASIELDVAYNFEETRLVDIHFWSPWVPGVGASWLGSKQLTITPGQGVATFRLSNGSAPAPGAAYEFRVWVKDATNVTIWNDKYFSTIVAP